MKLNRTYKHLIACGASITNASNNGNIVNLQTHARQTTTTYCIDKDKRARFKVSVFPAAPKLSTASSYSDSMQSFSK
jgi:hypothetical protein